jgi:transcriptional regulator with XRE-family HTH domain
MSETSWAEDIADRHEQLAELLTEERKARKIRQQQLALQLRQPQSRISRIENGECHIDVGEFLALADAIGFDPGIALRKIQDAFLQAMTLGDGARLVEFVRAAGWERTDADTKFEVLSLINAAITALRERAELPPIDDALPDENPTAFLVVREMFR